MSKVSFGNLTLPVTDE